MKKKNDKIFDIEGNLLVFWLGWAIGIGGFAFGYFVVGPFFL